MLLENQEKRKLYLAQNVIKLGLCAVPLSVISRFFPLFFALANCCLPPYRLAPRCPQHACGKSASAAAMVTTNSCSSAL
jgi:hypothetical protein